MFDDLTMKEFNRLFDEGKYLSGEEAGAMGNVARQMIQKALPTTSRRAKPPVHPHRSGSRVYYSPVDVAVRYPDTVGSIAYLAGKEEWGSWLRDNVARFSEE